MQTLRQATHCGPASFLIQLPRDQNTNNTPAGQCGLCIGTLIISNPQKWNKSHQQLVKRKRTRALPVWLPTDCKVGWHLIIQQHKCHVFIYFFFFIVRVYKQLVSQRDCDFVPIMHHNHVIKLAKQTRLLCIHSLYVSWFFWSQLPSWLFLVWV